MKNEGRRAHWFGPTQGAGAIGGENPSDMGDNPFMPGKHYNMTNQARLMTADPALAEKMKKAAENYSEREARLAARK
ncbi:MAG: hypothetical protein HRU16_07440, partial [Planctomycetes bacterium]|nr:hypothetical protein [Planctomycetota bacterium]